MLNRQCNVRKDSANNRRGRTVVNDDILTALSGTAVTTVEGRYGRIAVPIRDYKEATVIGVVYVSFFLGQEYQKVLSSMDTIMTVFTDLDHVDGDDRFGSVFWIFAAA